MKEIITETLYGYMLKNKSGKYLNEKHNWSDYSNRTMEFGTLQECMDVKSSRPTAIVIRIMLRHTTIPGLGMIKTERIESVEQLD